MSIKKYIKRGLTFIKKGIPVKHVTANVTILAPNELLRGRVALITGGTSGIGYEIAKAFVNAGATVVITGRSITRVNKACSEIKSFFGTNTDIYGVELDNSQVSQFRRKLQQISDILDGKSIDIIVNNAGIRGGHIGKATEKEYDSILDTNLKGVFFLIQMIAKEMIKNNIQGNILNIASASSVRPALSAYHISKWGIKGLTEGLARSLAPYGICVNAIAPGPTATPMLNKPGTTGDDISHHRNLLGRYVTAEEVANMAVILVSDMSRSIIGDTIFMSGGGGVVTNEDVDFVF